MEEKKDVTKIMLGIDLGTTNSAVSIYENGESVIYTNSAGDRTTPSVIAFKKARLDKKTKEEIPAEWIVGKSAKNQAALNHLNTLYGVKRLIGRRFDDPEVAKMQELSSYKIVKGPTGDAWVEVNGQAMAPAEISAKVLRELKDSVLKKLGLEKDVENGSAVVEAVITVPAYFNDSQRQATKDAGKIAGLNVKRIVNEPTAAALAYGMDQKTGSKIAVFDLGGGTFDVSILSIDPIDGNNTIEVLATNGDTFLGGENFDERVTEYFVELLNKETDLGIDLKDKASKDKNAQIIQRLREFAEKTKIELSFQESVEVKIPFLTVDAEGQPVHFETTLTRRDLEGMLKDLIEQTLKPCQMALADAGKKLNGEKAAPLKPTEIDDVILVGGQTRMPLVVETVKKFFGKEPRRDVNPDEIVAMGAAAQGAVLQGKIDNVLLLDVIPLSIGIRTPGDVMTKIVPRNASIPGEFKETFYTSEDNQPNVMVQVYQGERERASDNNRLGEVMLGSIDPRSADALPRGSKGTVAVDIILNIDADGVLRVTAKNPLTGKEQKAMMKANGGLSQEQVERMLKDAEANAEKDKLFRLSITAEPNADAVLAEAAKDVEQDAEGNYTDQYFKAAPEELRREFLSTVEELTAAKQKKDVLAMVEKTARVSELRARIGDAFNEAARQAATNDNAPAAEQEAPEAVSSTPAAPKGPAAG